MIIYAKNSFMHQLRNKSQLDKKKIITLRRTWRTGLDVQEEETMQECQVDQIWKDSCQDFFLESKIFGLLAGLHGFNCRQTNPAPVFGLRSEVHWKVVH